MSTIPPLLQPGDTVGLIATARAVDFSIIDKAQQIFSQWGLKTHLPHNLYAQHHQFAGTDAQRAEDLQDLLDDPEIKLIFCLRGGYGTSRIIDLIDFTRFKKHPKWIAGFSDVTVLHAHLNNMGFATLHCQMPVLFDQVNHPQTIESIHQVLFNGHISYTFNAHPLNRNGEMKGKLIGGNLSVLHSIMDTASEPDFSGNILFLEDLDEYLYHIDRMMVHFKRSGRFHNLAGMIVGHMSDMNDNTIPFGKEAYAIIREHVEQYDFPVIFGFPSGHLPANLSILLGSEITIYCCKSNVYFHQ